MKLKDLLGKENPPIKEYLKSTDLFMEGCVNRYEECPVPFHLLDHQLITQQCLDELEKPLTPAEADQVSRFIKSGAKVDPNKVLHLGRLGIQTLRDLNLFNSDIPTNILTLKAPPLTQEQCDSFKRKEKDTVSPSWSSWNPTNWGNQFQEFKNFIDQQISLNRKKNYQLFTPGIFPQEEITIEAKLEILHHALEKGWIEEANEIRDETVRLLNQFSSKFEKRDWLHLIGVSSGMIGTALLFISLRTYGAGPTSGVATGAGRTVFSETVRRAAVWLVGTLGIQKYLEG